VAVGGIDVAVGGIDVAVGGIDVAVGKSRVLFLFVFSSEVFSEFKLEEITSSVSSIKEQLNNTITKLENKIFFIFSLNKV
ncbi:MAG: hypothetical protein CL772_05515, partial [Chloroflexi bacterium]|nr:hypothetical protein [Chloroflexota bacterium]